MLLARRAISRVWLRSSSRTSRRGRLWRRSRAAGDVERCAAGGGGGGAGDLAGMAEKLIQDPAQGRIRGAPRGGGRRGGLRGGGGGGGGGRGGLFAARVHAVWIPEARSSASRSSSTAARTVDAAPCSAK